ncbi:acyltransferase family protein [Ottowia thiooxydans]|uniref:Peptidoglycan/LPS O-acetylase OafA/YrhL n=1 Tax=Ottowia thiooxydans TaxID=219182 RepID=A0ABV2QFN7_9BURK
MQVSALHRPDIDGLRAIAILGVLAFHAFPQAVPGGFIGVDVFFVISGYVVSLSLISRTSVHDGAGIAQFYARRVRRLFPALLCTLIAVALAGFWLLPTPQLSLMGKHILGSAGFAQNLMLWQEAGYFDAVSHEKWLLHLWSLGIEEQFYLLLPLLFLLINRAKQAPATVQPSLATDVGLTTKPRANPILLLLAGLAAASFALSLWQSRYSPSAGFYWPLGRFWEFLLGVMLADWHLRKAAEPRNPSATPSGRFVAASAIALLLLAFLVFSERPWQGWHFPGPLALAPALTTCALLCTAQSGVNQRLLAHPLMRYVGLISYPLYLWHWPIMAYLNSLDPQHIQPWTRVPGLALALGLAALTYRFAEQPMRRLASDYPKTVTGGLATGMLAMALGGYWMWQHTPTSWPDLRNSAASQVVLWDETHLYRDSTCLSHAAVNPWKRDDFFCRGNPDTAQWALLGDSHGNALAAGLMKAMPGQWVNLGGGGCMPFNGVDSGSDELGLQCPHEIPEAFLRHVLRSPHIKGVLINVRGAFYVNGTDKKPSGTESRRWLREVPPLSGSSPKPQTDNASIFRAGVRRTLTELGSAGKKVLWLLNTPELGADVNACLRPRTGQGWLGPAPACAISAASHDARNALYREIIETEVARWNAHRPTQSAPVQVLNPAEPLCTGALCPLVLQGQPLYRDSDHLSIQGSDLVAQWLVPRLPGLGNP